MVDYLAVRRLSRSREHTCSYAAPSHIQGARGNAANVCRLRHVRTLLFSYRRQLYQRSSSRRTPLTFVRQRRVPTFNKLLFLLIRVCHPSFGERQDKAAEAYIPDGITRRYRQTRWILLASKCMRSVSPACGSSSTGMPTLLTFHCRRVGASTRGTSSSTRRSKRESLTRATCKS